MKNRFNIMFIAQIWIKHRLKICVQLCWFNWFIITLCNWMQSGSFLPAKSNFLSFLTRVWVKVYFPLKSPVTYFLSVLINIARWSINIMNYQKQRNVISKHFTFIFWLSDRSITYIRNSEGPRINLWGTPTRASAQD